MEVKTSKLPWPLDEQLTTVLNKALTNAIADDGVTVTFRDPDFTPQSGGFHPVEIALNRQGELLYITDFCYVGQSPHCDLCKCLDFDFSLGLFQHYGMEHPIVEGLEMFRLWQSNFLAYHKMDAYTVSVEP